MFTAIITDRLTFAQSLNPNEIDLAIILMDELRSLRRANKPFYEIELRLTELAQVTRQQPDIRLDLKFGSNIGISKGKNNSQRRISSFRQLAQGA